MTTVSEFLEGQFVAPAATETEFEGVSTRARVRARLAVTDGDRKASRVVSWLVARARTVGADLAAAWPWRGSPPTLAQLWAARVPDRDRVPGRSRALWAGWSVYNHVLLPVFAVAYPSLWWLAHPARLVLTVVLAVPLFFVWI